MFKLGTFITNDLCICRRFDNWFSVEPFANGTNYSLFVTYEYESRFQIVPYFVFSIESEHIEYEIFMQSSFDEIHILEM